MHFSFSRDTTVANDSRRTSFLHGYTFNMMMFVAFKYLYVGPSTDALVPLRGTVLE
jgi:hypothetical protein